MKSKTTNIKIPKRDTTFLNDKESGSCIGHIFPTENYIDVCVYGKRNIEFAAVESEVITLKIKPGTKVIIKTVECWAD